jgi:hypothetical protein
LDDLSIPESFHIKYPSNIDDLPYVAVIELERIFNNNSHLTQSQLVARIISLSCFSSNSKSDFDTDSEEFIEFEKIVLDSDAMTCLKILESVRSSYEMTQKKWARAFAEVNVEDIDYMNAGGALLDKFKVLKSIKHICKEFNLTYYQAWQFPYGVYMMSSLENVTSNKVQRSLSKIKEDRMKSKRRRI